MHRLKYKYFLYLVPALLLATMAFVRPPDILKQLQASLETLRTQYGAEKVYLQLDKPYYTPGETVWLKGYVVEAATLQPSAKSRVLYVDLLNGANQPVHQLRLKAEAGKARGDLVLPDSLPSGTYRLTAYTQWMRNFGESAFFNQFIQVLSPGTAANPAAGNTKALAPALDLQFFPEGGDLILGLPNRVAFKATSAAGTGVTVSGSVYDDQGRKVVDFQDTHLGMGAFGFQPQPGRSYVARVKHPVGQVATYPLPAARPNGYVLRVDETGPDNHLQVTVRGNVGQAETLLLTGISQDALQFSRTFTLQPGQVYRQEIPATALPTGIIRLTLARADGEPLAERLAFVDRRDALNLTLRTDKKVFGNREQVTLSLEARDHAGRPVATDFSLAVTDAELVKQTSYATDIQSYLLLASDLRGEVEQPGYYFQSRDAKRKEALQYLLMTQGWRRFSWKDMATGKFPLLTYPAENSLSIRGKLLTHKGKAVPNGEALLYLKGQHQTFIATETDEQGRFAFTGFDFTGQADVVVQGTDARGRRNHLKVVMEEETYLPAPFARPAPQPALLAGNTRQALLQASSRRQTTQSATEEGFTLRGMLLPEVVVKGQRDVVEPFRLHRQADVVLKRQELPVAPSGNILESLQGRVAGLQVFRSGTNGFAARIRGQQAPPLYLIDGIPVPESALNGINQFDISRVEVLKSPASAGIYGGGAAGGVIAIFTQRGGEEVEEVTPGTYIIVHQVKGYSKVREFYSPRYDNPGANKDIPDLRSTIYWNPQVRTDANGKATLTFYTADRPSTYRVIAEGVSDAGRPGRATLTFPVGNSSGDPQ